MFKKEYYESKGIVVRYIKKYQPDFIALSIASLISASASSFAPFLLGRFIDVLRNEYTITIV